jgi:formamidopyrimidine-DNA glycosylase
MLFPADEVLYHARVHPEQRCHTLTDEQTAALHYQTSEVCRIAVSVNADNTKFPDTWLFNHRWVCVLSRLVIQPESDQG